MMPLSSSFNVTIEFSDRFLQEFSTFRKENIKLRLAVMNLLVVFIEIMLL